MKILPTEAESRFLQALADLFENTPLETDEEEVEAALRELGHDPEKLVARIRAVIQLTTRSQGT